MSREAFTKDKFNIKKLLHIHKNGYTHKLSDLGGKILSPLAYTRYCGKSIRFKYLFEFKILMDFSCLLC